MTFTDEGNEFLETQLQVRGLLEEDQSLYDPESTTIVHHVNQALRAHKLFQKDKDYIVRNNDVVLIDDIASTGATLVECARLARDRGARNVTAIVTHALFDDGAIPVGRSQLLSDIWSTDSVPHPSNRIHLAVPVAAACSSVLEAIHRKRRAAASPC